jgi:5-oxoprolinase (ATP-hydrolysing)
LTVVPEGCVRDPQPRPPGAWVTGNVETSMCATNAIFGALGLMAASRCTMDNYTFANARHQRDETIPGATMRSILPSKTS